MSIGVTNEAAGRSWLRFAVALGALLVSAILVGGSAMVLHRNADAARDKAEAWLERTAQVAEGTVNRQLLQVDSALASLPDLLASAVEPSGRISAQAAARLLRGFNFQSLVFRDLILADGRGEVWASARPRADGKPLELQPGDEGSVANLVGPTRNPLTGEWSLYLMRPVAVPGRGEMRGMAEIPLAAVTSLLTDTAGAPDLRIRLERAGGELIASIPHDELAIGRSVRAAPLEQGEARTVADPASGQAVLAVARATLYDDVLVHVSIDETAALAGWLHDRDRFLMVVGAAELIVLALAGGLFAALAKGEELDRERARARTMLENAVEAMSDGFVMWDGEDRLVTCNQAFRDLYPISAPLIKPGAALRDLLREGAARGQYGDVGPNIEAWVERQIDWHEQAEGALERHLPDGRWLLLKERRTLSGETVGIRTDITALKNAQSALEDSNARAREAMLEVEKRNKALIEQEKQIRFMAQHDALTGLPNRVLLRHRLDAMLAAPEERDQCALLYLDLDKFKEVNDTLGHPAGDALLREVAARLKACLRPSDLVARLGGDEFALAGRFAAGTGEAEAFGRRIVEALGAPVLLEGRNVAVGASIGIAMAGSGVDVDTLFRNADMALYEAKEGGRGTCRFFEPRIEHRLKGRVEMARDLAEALGREEFTLAYQPVFDLATGTPNGVEALVRWNHPERGSVSPADFIPVAEDKGLIHDLGAFVLERACRDAAALPRHMKVAVNLSPVQLRSNDIFDRIAGALRRSGLAPERLELEITESALVEDTERVARLLHRLAGLGARIVLDDFGTGYSALSYLQKFPFGKIKIDQSFVREMTTRPNSAAIVSAIVGLADQLGLSTTAEGVETAEHLALVRKAGCREAQGFFLGRPGSILHAVEAKPVPAWRERLERRA